MQTAAPNENPQKVPAGLAIIGSIIAIIGCVMDWGTIGGTAYPTEQTEPGTEWTAGLGTLVLSVIIVILAGIMFARGRSEKGGRGLAIASLILALFALFAAAYSAFAPEAAAQQFEASDIAEANGISEAQAEAAIEAAFENGALEVSAEMGAYIATLGTLLAAIGAVMGIAAAKRNRVATGYPASTPVGSAGHHAVVPDQPSSPGPQGTPPNLGSQGPGATGPGTPPVGGSSPADATGDTSPPPGTPPGGSTTPRP